MRCSERRYRVPAQSVRLVAAVAELGSLCILLIAEDMEDFSAWLLNEGIMVQHTKQIPARTKSPSSLFLIRPITIFVMVLGFVGLAYGEDFELFVQLGHSGRINSVNFSPDGNFVLSGSTDNTLKLWNVNTGREIRTFRGHSGSVNSVSFSPDGNFVLSGSTDKTLKLWNVNTGREIRTFRGHSGSVNSVSFSPDGEYAVSGSNDKSLILWDIDKGERIKVFCGHNAAILSVAFSFDGRYVVSGSGESGYHYPKGRGNAKFQTKDTTIRLWEVSSSKQLKAFEGHSREVISVAFSQDGKHILSSGLDSTVRFWDVESGNQIWSYDPDEYGNRLYCAISPGGRYALVGVTDAYKHFNGQGHTRLLELSTGKIIREFQEDHAETLCFSPNGDHFLSANYTNALHLWDVLTAKKPKTFGDYLNQPVYSALVTPDNRKILSAYEDGVLILWDLMTGELVQKFKGESCAYGLAISPDGEYAFSAHGDLQGRWGTVCLWGIASGKLIWAYERDDVLSGSQPLFSPDGRYVITYSCDNELRLWDLQQRKQLDFFPENTWSGNFTLDGKYIVVTTEDHDVDWHTPGSGTVTAVRRGVEFLDASTGSREKRFKGDYGSTYPIDLSSDGKYGLSIAGGFKEDEYLKIWKLSSGNEITRIKAHLGKIYSAKFSPSGNMIASVGVDNKIILWKALSGKRLKTLYGHCGNINSIAFSPNGKNLVSAGSDGTVRIWDISSGKEGVNLIRFENDEWLSIIPEGYFNGSPNGAKYINVRKGLSIYSIDNFFEDFYNPTIIAQVLQGKGLKINNIHYCPK